MSSFFEALNHPPCECTGHKPNIHIYRPQCRFEHGKVKVTTPFHGKLIDPENFKITKTEEMDIAYSKCGDAGLPIIFMHGFPTSKSQCMEVQRLLSPFCRVVSIDILGTGQSSMPLEYGKDEKKGLIKDSNSWDWVYDTFIVKQIKNHFFPNEKCVFIADGWGCGVNTHYVSSYLEDALAFIQINPIGFDGYPIPEIQAIGRLSAIEDESLFNALSYNIDSTISQIIKSMSSQPDKSLNKDVIRDIISPYIEVDYEREIDEHETNSLRMKTNAIRVLSDRAASISPLLLLPYNEGINVRGVKYENIKIPALIINSEYDNVVSNNQKYKFAYTMYKTRVDFVNIPRSGHLVCIEQPEIVAEEILNFLRREFGNNALADIFLGYTGIWKGDEGKMIKDLRKLYGMIVRGGDELWEECMHIKNMSMSVVPGTMPVVSTTVNSVVRMTPVESSLIRKTSALI